MGCLWLPLGICNQFVVVDVVSVVSGVVVLVVGSVADIVVVSVVFVLVGVFFIYIKFLKMLLRCALAGCGRRASLSEEAPISRQKRVVAKAGHLSQRCSADSTFSSTESRLFFL